MADPLGLAFDRPPASGPLFAKALWPKPSVLAPGARIPRMVARLAPAVPDPRALAAYRVLCGFAHDDTLPATYPHVLAAPLHLALLTHDTFPLRLLGAVHVRNRIVQHHALRADDPLSIQVSVAGYRDVDNGVEVTVHTEVEVNGSTPWESDSTMLIRNPRAAKKEAKPFTPPDLSSFHVVTMLVAPADIGRRYGRVAHDLNPIHVHALSARAFGFPRAIAHGMWTFARCVAELQRATFVDGCTIDVAFKRPLLLPGKAFLVARGGKSETEYVLHDGEAKTVFLTGTMRRANS